MCLFQNKGTDNAFANADDSSHKEQMQNGNICKVIENENNRHQNFSNEAAVKEEGIRIFPLEHTVKLME